jgi:transposase
MSQSDSTSAVIVGIDWGDETHAVCVLDSQGRQHSSTLRHDPDEIARWVEALQRRFPAHRILVALEQTRGALAHALREFPALQLYPINPKQLARYRESISPSGRKNDPGDAALLAQFLQERHRQLRPWRPETPETQRLTYLSELRRKLVEERKTLHLKLLSTLKLYFPFVLQRFGTRLLSPLVLDLLTRWPSLTELQRAHPKVLRSFWARHRLTNAAEQTELLTAIRAATPLTTVAPLVESYALYVTGLVTQLVAIQKSIAQFDEQLRIALEAHPDREIFQSLPGAGKVLAPRLLAACGSDRQRFRSADELQQYVGIAPVSRQSGKANIITRRHACSKFLRQTFHEFADHARKWSRWSKAFYDMKRAAGMKHQAAVRALAFKWIRIIYHLWKTSTTYCDDNYLQTLNKHHSPLLKFLPQP